MPSWIWLTVATALVFDFINGFHDTANAIATSVLTRALSITQAIFLASGLNFLGALISVSVATTIGKGIVDPQDTTHSVVLAALLGAIVWNLITWQLGLPSSSSHALIGGTIGAVAADHTVIHAGAGTLGYAARHGLRGKRDRADVLFKMLSGRCDWEMVGEYDYLGNLPAIAYREFEQAYPDARFILTIRDPEQWWV